MKIKSIIAVFIIFFLGALSANATQLPKDLKNYLLNQRKVPTIRYDGILVYNNDVMYIPVLPAYPEKPEEIKIKET